MSSLNGVDFEEEHRVDQSFPSKASANGMLIV